MTEDYERIDWLERVSAEIAIELRYTHFGQNEPPGMYEVKVGRTVVSEGSTLREAIDGAMKAIL